MTIATTVAAGGIGNDALRTLHGRLSETLRPSDFVGIVEGGAFAVMLPETDLFAAELAGHRILREFDSHPISVNGQLATVDVRIGSGPGPRRRGVPGRAVGAHDGRAARGACGGGRARRDQPHAGSAAWDRYEPTQAADEGEGAGRAARPRMLAAAVSSRTASRSTATKSDEAQVGR